MRYLVLTDVHANLEALDACLEEARRRGYDRVLVLGDLVGYGADPNLVIERTQALHPIALVRGNHDKVVCGLESPEDFNPLARNAVRWTSDALTPEHRAWLAALPEGPRIVDDLVEICHGSPFDEDAYIFDELDALHALRAAVRPLCLFGHTHCPATFIHTAGTVSTIAPAVAAEKHIFLETASKYLINPGAVGQPRDGDPRAACAIVDVERRSIELYRVSYPVDVAQAKIAKAGLPKALAERLGAGR